MTSTFYVLREFDDELLETLPELYKLIEHESQVRDGHVSVVINSPGGYAHVLEAFLAAFRAAKAQDVIVETVVTGMAGSCASILAINGTKGHRLISQDSEHYIHWGEVADWGRTPVQSDRNKDRADRHFAFVKRQYTQNAKIPRLEKKLQDDSFRVYPEQCVEYQLADKVV